MAWAATDSDKCERIDEKFLDYFFKVPDHWQSIGSLSTGTNVRRQSLHPTQFERAEIPLPPLAEQRRVVARIEELAAQIHEARTLRQQAAEEAAALAASQIKALFEMAQDSGWECGRLGNYVADDCYGSSEKTHDDISGTPVLRMGNIQNGRLDLRDLKYLHIMDAGANQRRFECVWIKLENCTGEFCAEFHHAR